MKLSKAVEGFILSKSVEGLSKRTLETYQPQLNHLTLFLEDPELEHITTNDLRRFLDYLRNDYKPQRWGKSTKPLAARTIRNYWICLRSFYTWAGDELSTGDVLKPIKAPKPNVAQTEPFTQEEIHSILSMAGHTRESHRNTAIILVFLDTGIRSSELCDLTIGDVSLKLSRIIVSGKGDKIRHCRVGERTRRALWRYLADRDEEEYDDPLFMTVEGRRMRRHWVRELIRQIGERGGVEHVHPHRFRTTFATQYLRNGGDVFTLQILLGHTSLKMVRYYAKLAAVDAATVHRKASPVDNWLK